MTNDVTQWHFQLTRSKRFNHYVNWILCMNRRTALIMGSLSTSRQLSGTLLSMENKYELLANNSCKLDPNYCCDDENYVEKNFNLFTKEVPNTTIKIVCMRRRHRNLAREVHCTISFPIHNFRESYGSQVHQGRFWTRKRNFKPPRGDGWTCDAF